MWMGMRNRKSSILFFLIGVTAPQLLPADELDDLFYQELVEPVFDLAYPMALEGDARAQMYLGVLYWDIRFSDNDPKKAMMWLQIAYANGRRDAAQFMEPLFPYFLPYQVENIARAAAHCIDSGYTECEP